MDTDGIEYSRQRAGNGRRGREDASGDASDGEESKERRPLYRPDREAPAFPRLGDGTRTHLRIPSSSTSTMSGTDDAVSARNSCLNENIPLTSVLE